MEVLILQVFVSLLLVVGSVVLLAYSMKHADHEHADRLALFPIEDESRPVVDTDRDGQHAGSRTDDASVTGSSGQPR